MFGYVKNDMPNTYMKDVVLYKATYCGLCKAIGKSCGAKGRFTLTYDLTFLSLFLHNYLGKDFVINKEHCITHPIIKRPIAKVDDLTCAIGALNVIFAYYKLCDDVLDENKGKIKRDFFKSSYNKAKKNYPELDGIVKKYFQKLLELEKSACDSIDIVSDVFGSMMKDLVCFFVKEDDNEALNGFSYSLGKWIYLIDALDDFDKDIKSGSFNVFKNAYKGFADKKEVLSKNISDLQLIFGTILSDINECSKRLDYKFNHDLIDNILSYGLSNITKKVMEI